MSSYNEANQLTGVIDSQGETTSFTYDANGALTGKTNGTDTTNMTYNGMDKLTQVQTPQATVDYAYDALGRRIQRTEAGATRNLHYGATSDLYDHETDGSGTLTKSMLKGPDGLISITSYSGGATTDYLNYNPHGDSVLITDSLGTETESARYDAFGNVLGGQELTYGYTGKWMREKDTDTQMIRMGVREYEPALGRFVSVAPLRGMPLDPQLRNRYQYTGNNPMTRYDLDGRETIVSFAGDGITFTASALDDENEISMNIMEALVEEQRNRTGSDGNGPGSCREAECREGISFGDLYHEWENATVGPLLMIGGLPSGLIAGAGLEMACISGCGAAAGASSYGIGAPGGAVLGGVVCAPAAGGLVAGGAALSYAF